MTPRRQNYETTLQYLLDHARVEPLQIVCGVYFLIERNKVVYVGQSTDVFVRVRRHYKDPKKLFDKWAYIVVDPDELIRVEREYIDLFQPYLNIAGLPKTKRRRPREEKPARLIVHGAKLYNDIVVTDEDRRGAVERLAAALYPEADAHIAPIPDRI